MLTLGILEKRDPGLCEDPGLYEDPESCEFKLAKVSWFPDPGQKPLFLPQLPNFETLISSLFFHTRKICSHHHCHHFHLRFCWVWSIGWGRWFSVEKLEKEELNIEHFWCGMGWRVFEGKKTLASKNTSISKSAADELKNVLL